MSHITSPRRVARKPVLLATASLLALAVASSDLRAQSAQSTGSPPSTASAPPGQWSSWSEAGLTGHPALDPALGLPPLGPFADLTPGAGWEGALGFDYRLAQCGATTAPWLVKANPAPCLSPYHVFGQFRYGQNNGASDPFSRTSIPISLRTTAFLGTPNRAFGDQPSRREAIVSRSAQRRDIALRFLCGRGDAECGPLLLHEPAPLSASLTAIEERAGRRRAPIRRRSPRRWSFASSAHIGWRCSDRLDRAVRG
jgi:hypothetical protein